MNVILGNLKEVFLVNHVELAIVSALRREQPWVVSEEPNLTKAVTYSQVLQIGVACSVKHPNLPLHSRVKEL